MFKQKHTPLPIFVQIMLFALLAFIPASITAQDSGIGLVIIGPIEPAGPDWLDGWQCRRAVEISNPCGEELVDYQVEITLDAGFEFGNALPDGSDIRVTDADGLTVIPSWIESWDAAGESATIWVKVPLIPVSGTILYLYYCNADPAGPELVEMPPVGPWDKYPTYIDPIGDPLDGAQLLAENIVYDDATGHYWMVFAMYRGGSRVGLMWSDTPEDNTSWNWVGEVLPSANSPHIINHGGVWHIFFADRTIGPPYPISVATSTDIDGPYTYIGPVLTVTEAWEAYRVDEPYVFQRNDGKWILMYMGDQGSTTERIGYAEADNIMGPYTKFAGNPCIDFGPPGSIDAGTVADPWVVEFHGVYYIGYTVSPSKSSPWNTALVTTSDWTTFTKHGIILDLGGSGDWDQFDAFRGAVTRFGDTYYFAYTGSPGSTGNYVAGLATMPVFMEEPMNDPDEVFEFIDTFDDALDKWVVTFSAPGGSVGVSGGILTLTGVPDSYVQMRANRTIGTGTLLEAYAAHPEAGLDPGGTEGNAAAEVGYKPGDMSWTNVMRMMDWPDLQKYVIQSSSGGMNSGYIPTAVDFDTDWHMYKIFRSPGGTAEFQIDDNPFEALGASYVPTVDLYPWLMSYARNTVSESNFNVDWLRVRKWCGGDAGVVLGAEEQNAPPTASIFGQVTYASNGLEAIKIDLLNTGGDPLTTAMTDASGDYIFPDLPAGEYVVVLNVPMGFEPAGESSVMVALEGIDTEVNFELTECTTGKMLSIWWFKNYFQAYFSGNPLPHEIDLNACGQTIFDHYYARGDAHAIQIEGVTFMDGTPRPLNFDDIANIVLLSPDNSTEGRIRMNLMCLMVNVANGCISQNSVVSADGATLSQAIKFVAESYQAATYDWRHWYFLSRVMMGLLMPAGFVPLGTPNIMYKLGDQADSPLLPNDFALAQNYPNPFNPGTVIGFSLPHGTNVELIVYNITGRKVATIADGFFPAGAHQVTWTADEYSSGIYFYRLKAGDYTETRKMILIK